MVGVAGKVLAAMESVLCQQTKADSGRLALKGIMAAVTAVVSSSTALDIPSDNTSLDFLTSSTQHEHHAQFELDAQHAQREQREHHARRGDAAQHAQLELCNHRQQEGFWNLIPQLAAVLNNVMVFYTLQCTQPAADLPPGSSQASTDSSQLATRMRPILNLLAVTGDFLSHYSTALTQQLQADVSAEEPLGIVTEHMSLARSPKPLQGPVGPQEVHAVLDALLLLCQHPPLLPYVLARHRQMPSVLHSCRSVLCLVVSQGQLLCTHDSTNGDWQCSIS